MVTLADGRALDAAVVIVGNAAAPRARYARAPQMMSDLRLLPRHVPPRQHGDRRGAGQRDRN